MQRGAIQVTECTKKIFFFIGKQNFNENKNRQGHTGHNKQEEEKDQESLKSRQQGDWKLW